MIKPKAPSPAMAVAIVALVFAVVGSAIAGVAAVSVLSKKEKKQTRNIAKDEIRKAAPALSVANAANAQNATNAAQLGGFPPSAFANADSAPQARRVVVADPTPGDSGAGRGTLLTDGPWTLIAECSENLSGQDVAEILLSGPSLFSVGGVIFSGVAVNGNSVLSVASGETTVGLLARPTSSGSMGYGSFTAVAPDGDVLTGFGSMELNDAQAGSACTFGATTIR